MERGFKGVWIPKEIWLDKTLGWSEKLLLVEITSLDNDEGCFASNEYFADFFNLSKDRISKLISALKNKGYLTVELVYKKGTRKIDKRIVKITDRYRCKQLEGIGENNYTPIGENAEDNNTVINNTKNNTKNKDIYSNEFERFWSIYPRKVDKKKAYKSFKTAAKNHSLETILVGTEKYAQQVQHTDKQYIKHPTTFLNNDSFIDGFEERSNPVGTPQNIPDDLEGLNFGF